MSSNRLHLKRKSLLILCIVFFLPISYSKALGSLSKFDSHIQNIDLFNGIHIIDFLDKRYVVSYYKINKKSDLIGTIRVAEELAKSELIKFIHGDDIKYNLSFIKMKTVKKGSFGIETTTKRIINEIIKSNSSGVLRGIKQSTRINSKSIEHYAFIAYTK
jgi:hypothetical protein